MLTHPPRLNAVEDCRWMRLLYMNLLIPQLIIFYNFMRRHAVWKRDELKDW